MRFNWLGVDNLNCTGGKFYIWTGWRQIHCEI